ncbi:MAG TPA: pitrilysin family protein [Flavitalea sp.]|nr:pitrilysin family protein [Flavitalea sp.]
MKKLTTILIIASVFSTAAFAQKQTPPEGSTPKDFKLSEKKAQSYPNGLKTVFVTYGSIPKVSVSLIIKTGNIHEGKNQTWLADLTGKMLKEGTSSMDFKLISKKAASMGGSINVSVGVEQVNIGGSVLSEFAAEFITMVSELAMNPAFPASELERIKTDMKRDLSVQKGVPQNIAEEKFFQTMYKDHPYGRYYPTEAMITSYTLPMVKDFYNKNFGAKRSVVYVVGNFDEAAVKSAIDKGLGKWKAGPAPVYQPATLVAKRDTAIIDRKGAPQTTVMIGLPVLTPKDKDYVAQVITNSLLGGSFGSRITSNIRENKGYTYSPYSYVQNRHGGSIWVEAADVTSEHTIASLNEIEKEIKRLQSEAPSKQELEGIQRYEAGIFVLRNTSPDGIINQLNFLDQNGLPDAFLNNYVQNMYKVTPEKVSQLAKDKFKYENMTVVMVGDKAQIEHQAGKKTEKKAF